MNQILLVFPRPIGVTKLSALLGVQMNLGFSTEKKEG